MPVIAPHCLRMGAAQSLASIHRPSLCCRRTSLPWIVAPLRIWRTSASYWARASMAIRGLARPSTSLSVQPNRRSAAGFHRLIFPSGSSSRIARGAKQMSPSRECCGLSMTPVCRVQISAAGDMVSSTFCAATNWLSEYDARRRWSEETESPMGPKSGDPDAAFSR